MPCQTQRVSPKFACHVDTQAPSPDSGDDSFIVVPTMSSRNSGPLNTSATLNFPHSFSETTSAAHSPGGDSPSPVGSSLNSSPTQGSAAGPEPVLVAVQDMIAAFTARMQAAMDESEARTAIRFSEALQAIESEAKQREGLAIKNTLVACRAEMEGNCQRALVASEARSAEGLGRVLERLDRLEKNATVDSKKYAKTHRELRNSIASAEERATAALREHRTDFEKHIAGLKVKEDEFTSRFKACDDECEAIRSSHNELDGWLMALEDRLETLTTELDALRNAQDVIKKEQESVRKLQEEVRAAREELKKAQEDTKESAAKLETRTDSFDKSLAIVEQKLSASEKAQSSLALNSDLGDAEARICKLEAWLADLPKDHEGVWKAIGDLENRVDITTRYDSRIQDLEQSVGNIQEDCSATEAQVQKFETDFSNWRTKKHLSILDGDLDTRNKFSKAQSTLEDHAKKLKSLRTDIEHEATQRRKLLVKLTGMTLAFANDTSLSGVGKSHYPAIKTWLDELIARPATTPDVRSRAIHYSAWIANNV